MQPRRAASNVEMVLVLLGDGGNVAVRIHQTVRRIGWQGHHVPEVCDKHAVRACPQHAATGFSFFPSIFHVIFDVLDVVEN